MDSQYARVHSAGVAENKYNHLYYTSTIQICLATSLILERHIQSYFEYIRFFSLSLSLSLSLFAYTGNLKRIHRIGTAPLAKTAAEQGRVVASAAIRASIFVDLDGQSKIEKTMLTVGYRTYIYIHKHIICIQYTRMQIPCHHTKFHVD